MSRPSVAKDIIIELDGEERSLRLRFSAWESLGVNPLDPESLMEFLDKMNPEKAARLIAAGLAHEYRANGSRHGKTPPIIEELKDLIDVPMYVALTEELLKAFGMTKREPGVATTDPLQA